MDSYTLRVFKNEDAVETDLVTFIFENGVSKSGNSYLLNKSTFKNRIVSYLKDEGGYLAFALSIPHTISLKDSKFKSCLTTLLTVNVERRNEKLGKKVIEELISYTNDNGIFVGYHYIPTPRKQEDILVYSFFRSLNNEKAKESGYEITGNDFSVPDSSDISILPIKYEEFIENNFANRKLTIKLTQEEFDNLGIDCQIVKFQKGSKVIGVAIFKPVILYIGKSKNSVTVARLVYFECIEKFDYLTLSKLINYLQQKKFTVLSGVCTGVLSDDNLRRNLGMVTSGKLYLDFHNLFLEQNILNVKEINLLYM